MDNIWFATITDVAASLRRREISSVELTHTMLDRIKRLDPQLNSYLTVLPEQALAQAATADAELARGIDRGPLQGVPIGIKDLCFTKGIPTTCSSKILAGWRPDIDATVVTRLHAAGAVTLGKLNMTEFALSGYSPGWPVPRNPWNPALHPGLSSSGSGVATAAGLCFGSLGTDTGGSIRFPSSWCGVVGLKPTYGRVSRYGVFPLGMSLDHIGPMTRSVADAAAMLDVLAGHDPADPTTVRAGSPECSAAIGRSLKGVRIGFDEQYVGGGALADVTAAIYAAIEVFKAQGAQIVAVTLPPIDDVLPAWAVLCAAEALAAHEATYPSRAADYGPTFASFLKYAAQLSAKDYAKAHLARLNFRESFQSVFEQADALLCVGAFLTAPPAEVVDIYGDYDPDFNTFGRFTAPFNLSGNPTLSVPSGFTPTGVPHGLQLVGPQFGEAMLCQIGSAYEVATPWHKRRPPIG